MIVLAAFSSSWKHMKELQKVLEQKGIPMKKLHTDVSTRWCSTSGPENRLMQSVSVLVMIEKPLVLCLLGKTLI